MISIYTSSYGVYEDYTVWLAETSYGEGTFVVPTEEDGQRYECQVAGISGVTEPTWNDTVDETTEDGTVTWVCKDYGTKGPPLSAILDTEGHGGLPNKDVWVYNDDEADFYIHGSTDNENWRRIAVLSVPDEELQNTHTTFTTAYRYIRVATTDDGISKIEIVAGA